ncbi:MAG: hypothetical protein NTX09_12445, partial [Verrucomicrobia bacterium]|nr:hypothetical protein [Verrucomicrobiota bacterium]
LERWPTSAQSISMKSNMTNQSSNRTFKVWEYQVSHGQLLIRSPKTPATQTSPELLTNIDLVCVGVDYMAVPRVLHGIELLPPTADEIRHLETTLGKAIPLGNIKVLSSEGKRFSVVASSFSLSENDWDIFESPFKFRSQYRDKD